MIFGQDSVKQKLVIVDNATLQFAGGIGFMSVGFGRTFFKKESGNLDLLLGYVPESIGGINIWSMSLKYSHTLKAVKLKKEKLFFYPIGGGLLFNYAFGENYNKYYKRDLYPKGYYWFKNFPRMSFFYQAQLLQKLENDKTISLYMEFGTYDLYLFSWYGNRESIKFHSIFSTSLGVKFKFK